MIKAERQSETNCGLRGTIINAKTSLEVDGGMMVGGMVGTSHHGDNSTKLGTELGKQPESSNL